MNFGLRQRDFDNILKAIKHFPEIKTAIIYGSRAKDSYKKGSDVDLSIKGKDITSETVTRLSWQLNEEYPLPYFFDVNHYEQIENEDLTEHIDRVGKIIYKNDAVE